MGELDGDHSFLINHSLKPRVNELFRIATASIRNALLSFGSFVVGNDEALTGGLNDRAVDHQNERTRKTHRVSPSMDLSMIGEQQPLADDDALIREDARTFPARKPRQNIKHRYPKIVACGSGNAIHLPNVFAKVIAMSGKSQPNVCFIGTPFFDRDDKFESGTTSFREHGCSIERLMVADSSTTPSHDEMKRIVVNWADVIVVSGGNSLFAMLRWKNTGLDLLIRQASLKGTVLCGGSAGCGCWFYSMQTDSLKPEACKHSERAFAELSPEEKLDWRFVRISAMGYIRAFCVPHVDTVGTNGIARVDVAREMFLTEEDPGIPGIGIDEKAALVYENGRVTILSGGHKTIGTGEATVSIMLTDDAKGEVHIVPLEPNTGEAIPFDELIERSRKMVLSEELNHDQDAAPGLVGLPSGD